MNFILILFYYKVPAPGALPFFGNLQKFFRQADAPGSVFEPPPSDIFGSAVLNHAAVTSAPVRSQDAGYTLNSTVKVGQARKMLKIHRIRNRQDPNTVRTAGCMEYPIPRRELPAIS